jgi:hypothetical protein
MGRQDWVVIFGTTEEAVAFVGTLAAHGKRWGCEALSWEGRRVSARTSKAWGRIPGVVQAIDAHAGRVLDRNGSETKQAKEKKRRTDEPAADRPVPTSLEEVIRAAYLVVTRGKLNQYVRLALLRRELPDEEVGAVNAGLVRMQQKGEAVLYPIDDPQRLRPEDDAAAIRVSGERRDLLLIRRD